MFVLLYIMLVDAHARCGFLSSFVSLLSLALAATTMKVNARAKIF
jgi:hypothetical protein